MRLLIDSPQGLSGEVLASERGITRAAIWKTVRSLEEDGAQIESLRGQGYRLKTLPYNQLALSCLLPVPVCFYDDIDSTNSQARRLAGQGMKPPFVVVARTQSGGRGRRGRTFVSADGGIYMSLVVPASSYGNVETLTTRCALGVSDALSSLGFDSAIKWVNDIFVNGRKVVGILCEGVVSLEEMRVEEVVLGIGVNYETALFPSQLDGIAGSLYPDGAPLPKSLFLKELVDSVLRALNEDGYISRYRERCFILGRRINVISSSGTRAATALDVDDNAHLLVRYDDGSEEALSSGEVSIRQAP